MKALRLISLVTVLSLLLAACTPVTGPTPATGQQPTTGGSTEGRPSDMAATQELVMGGAWATGVPFFEGNWYIGDIVMGSGLIEQNEDGSLRPWAASSWDVSNDGLVHTFQLRPDLKWCTGRAITAPDIKWSWEWLNIRYKWAKDYAWYMVAGIDEFLTAVAEVGAWDFDKWGDAEISGVQALDDHTLQITLKQITPAFMDVLASGILGTWGFFDPEQVKRGTAEQPWHEHPDYCGGFGPFMVDSYDRDQQVSVLVPNPHYTLGPAPLLQKITFKVIEDRQTQLVLYESGELDIAVPADADLAQIINDANHPLHNQVKPIGMAGITWLGFNQALEPTNDPKIREALVKAVDWALLQETVFRNLNTKATGLIPAGPFYRADKPGDYRQDIEGAKQALAESSYGSAENVPQITYWVADTGDPQWAQLAQAMQQMVQDALGIEMVVTTESDFGYDKAHVFTDSYATFSLDAQGWLGYLFNSQTWLSTTRYHWGNEAADALIRTIETNPELDTRLTAFNELENTIFGEHWLVPLYWITVHWLVDPNVQGISISPTFRWINAEQVYIKQ